MRIVDTEATGERARFRGVRALVVDDSAVNRMVLRRKLGDWGFEVDEAADGVDARALIDAHATDYALLLLDHHLGPGESGLDLARLAREAGSKGGILVLGSIREVPEAEWRRAGADQWIPKPVHWSGLYDVVAELLFDVAGVDRPARRSSDEVLLVDDNAVNRKVVSTLLERLDVACVTATDGTEAVESCDDTLYRLVLMDLQMPKMDGLDATREIRRRARGQHQPIVALSAEDDPAERSRCLQAGMDGFLSKPITVDELRTALDLWARKS